MHALANSFHPLLLGQTRHTDNSTKPHGPSSTDMAVDQDIQGMEKAQLVQELKDLKASGIKANVSSNVEELKQRLHDARREPVPDIARAPTTVSGAASTSTTSVPAAASEASGSRNTAVPPAAGKVEDVVIEYESVHPTKEYCLQKLEQDQQQTIDLIEDESEIQRLDELLQPVVSLVDTVLSIKNNLTNLSSSSDGSRILRKYHSLH